MGHTLFLLMSALKTENVTTELAADGTSVGYSAGAFPYALT